MPCRCIRLIERSYRRETRRRPTGCQWRRSRDGKSAGERQAFRRRVHILTQAVSHGLLYTHRRRRPVLALDRLMTAAWPAGCRAPIIAARSDIDSCCVSQSVWMPLGTTPHQTADATDGRLSNRQEARPTDWRTWIKIHSGCCLQVASQASTAWGWTTRPPINYPWSRWIRMRKSCSLLYGKHLRFTVMTFQFRIKATETRDHPGEL